MLNILTLGDVVGTAAISYLRTNLWSARTRLGADFVIANGENASDIRGLTAVDAEALLDCGIDFLTMGNHTYGRRELYGFLEDDPRIIRPANFPPSAPGQGYATVRVDGYRVLIINVQGQVYMEPLADPFDTVERILSKEKGSYDFAVMDIHAEATSEKLALAHVFDGRIAAIFGTHTHVATADEQILPRGSGYITDLGMTGPIHGILGTEAAVVIEKFRTHMPQRFTVAQGEIRSHGALFSIDPSTGRCTGVRRITF